MVVTKFECLKIIYLISNYRKSISINKNQCKVQIKCILLVLTKFESVKVAYLISNYWKSICIDKNQCKFQLKMHSLGSY